MMKAVQIMFNTKDGCVNEAFCKKLDNPVKLDVTTALSAIEQNFGIRAEDVEGISYYPLEPITLM